MHFFTGAGTGIIVSCLFSPDSSIRTTVIIVGIIMIGIGWYKKSKNDKKVFQYIKEQKDSEIIWEKGLLSLEKVRLALSPRLPEM